MNPGAFFDQVDPKMLYPLIFIGPAHPIMDHQDDPT
jgi:hypothetical protein